MKGITKKIVSIITSLLIPGSCSTLKALDEYQYDSFEDLSGDFEDDPEDVDDEIESCESPNDGYELMTDEHIGWGLTVFSLVLGGDLGVKFLAGSKEVPRLEETNYEPKKIILELEEKDGKKNELRAVRQKGDRVFLQILTNSEKLNLLCKVFEKLGEVPTCRLIKKIQVKKRNKCLLSGNLFTSEKISRQIVAHAAVNGCWDRLSLLCLVAEIARILGLDTIFKINNNKEISLIMKCVTGEYARVDREESIPSEHFGGKEIFYEIKINQSCGKFEITKFNWETLRAGERYVSSIGTLYNIRREINLNDYKPKSIEDDKKFIHLPKEQNLLIDKLKEKLNRLNNTFTTKEKNLVGECFRYIYYGNLKEDDYIQKTNPSNDIEKLLALVSKVKE